jgi:hypothetical protein
MSRLKKRIVAQGSALTIVGTENAPEMLANPMVLIGPTTSGYQITSIITPDGRPIPASSPGSWGQVRAAGQA